MRKRKDDRNVSKFCNSQKSFAIAQNVIESEIKNLSIKKMKKSVEDGVAGAAGAWKVEEKV